MSMLQGHVFLGQVSNISRSPLRMDLSIPVLSLIFYEENVHFKGFLFEVASRRNPLACYFLSRPTKDKYTSFRT